MSAASDRTRPARLPPASELLLFYIASPSTSWSCCSKTRPQFIEYCSASQLHCPVPFQPENVAARYPHAS
eukprot:471284-Prymnesium_polylepis.2